MNFAKAEFVYFCPGLSLTRDGSWQFNFSDLGNMLMQCSLCKLCA